jgi:hypothetical protein
MFYRVALGETSPVFTFKVENPVFRGILGTTPGAWIHALQRQNDVINYR